MIRKVVWSLAILLLLLVIFYWELIGYGIRQARGQLSITFNTVPVEEVLADVAVPDSVKEKIRVVQSARTYAFEQLGLTLTDNYTTFYDQKGTVALWNLSASKPYALEPKQWSFPLLGSFPYKGYFDLERAKEEHATLNAAGWDTRIRPVGGWSTLGWTSDPILSNMLDRTEGALVELIIHELTHSTIFVKDRIEFNENLASFIGEQGTLRYLTDTYGARSEPYFDYLMAEEDSRMFRNQMLTGTALLDSMYRTFDANTPDSIMAEKKRSMIRAITQSIDTLHFHNPRYYDVFEEALPNNAFFLSYLRYYSAKDSLEALLNDTYDQDLLAFIKGMKEFHE